MRNRLFVLALLLWGCGQAPPKPKPEPTTKAEPVKTAPAQTEPAKTEPAKTEPAATTSAPASEPAAPPVRDLVSSITANGVEDPQGLDWGPEKANEPSSKTFKNAKLLGELSGARFMASMQSMTASLGADCLFCHKANDFSSDGNGHKNISRRMIEMSAAINKDSFENKLEVSCYTCHRGQKEPKDKPAAPASPQPKEAPDPNSKKPSGEVFKNVQILKDVPAGELRETMKKFNAALGVRCDFCHVKEKFEADEKPTKAAAREMLKMSMEINKTYFAGKKNPVTCNLCHQGASKPAVNVGPTVVVSATVAGQTAWRAMFGVAKWPSLPKTRGELEKALAPIPANEAIFGMILSTDTGELGHLPPGEYQLCGFALPAKEEDDKLKAERPVTCQPLTIAASPEKQTVKIEIPAP